MAGVSVSLMGVCHNSLGLTMFFLVLSALFLEVLSPAFSLTLLPCMKHLEACCLCHAMRLHVQVQSRQAVCWHHLAVLHVCCCSR